MLEPGEAVLVDVRGHPDDDEWTEPATTVRIAESGLQASVRLASGEVRLVELDRIEPG